MSDIEGNLLLAAPSLEDSTFAKSVVLMLEHGPAGAMGLVLNKETPLKLDEVLAQAEGGPVEGVEAPEGIPLHQGGPCPGPLFVLHADGCLGDSEPVPGLFVANDGAIIKMLFQTLPQPPMPWRAVGGYAGWGPGQLEAELEEGSWTVSTASAAELLNLDGDAGWLRLTRAAARKNLNAQLPSRAAPDDPLNN